MTHQFFICEICFQDIDGARAAMAELTKLGIESKIFEGISDPFSAAVFVGVWRVGDVSFEEIVFKIADQHGGMADCFGTSDHVPIPSDFGFHPEQTLSADANVQRAIASLVEYLEHDEHQHYDECQLNGVGDCRDHIWHAVKTARDWLEATAP
jgi:hypothetical protein